jgi:glyoxylase-like metal-dependent hydrolase (beta-lactamase superfamily II)
MAERSYFAMPHPGIFRVTSPLPFPGLDHVHAYLADGKDGGLVIIDTTLGGEDAWPRIEQSLRWLDRRPADLERIYLTHAHPDHVGLAHELQRLSGAPVVCHPIAEQGLERMQTPARWQRVAEHYVAHGRRPEQAIERSGFSIPMPEHIEHVQEGDTVTFAGSTWDVYWTPGHEWGHIVFFRPSDRLLIAGDTLLGKITPHIGYMLEPDDPLGQFLGSLDKLTSLDVGLVVPGHGRPFERGAERARVIRRHHEQRLRGCMATLMHRRPLPAIEVARELFGRNLMFFEERLALAETLAHLEYLRLRERLVREMVDGVWHYDLPERMVP